MADVVRPQNDLPPHFYQDLLGQPQVIAEHRCERHGLAYRIVHWRGKQVSLEPVADCIDLLIGEAGRVGAVKKSDSRWWEE